MRTLAFDTATEACSVALFDGDRLIAHDHRIIGRGHAEALLPAIAALPDGGRADVVRVGVGAGSFTGIRVAIAVARALAFAWNAELVGFSTLSLVAATAREVSDDPLLVVMEGGHGEWLCQPFAVDGAPAADLVSLTPAAAVAAWDQAMVAGNRAAPFVERRGSGNAIDALPDARHALRVPVIARDAAVRPLYARAPDARPVSAV